MPKLTLKPGHVQPVWAGHPWVYAQAIHRIEGGAVAGDEVEVVDPRGNFIGRGFYSPGSAIPVRIVVRDRATALDAAFFRARIQRAVERRRLFGLPSRETNALRMINADGDDLPGLVVDVFADVAVVQIGTVGMKRREELLLDALHNVLATRAIVDRTSPTTARNEKFRPVEQPIVRGDTTLAALSFQERGIAYDLPLSLAQKTGFYLDQRPMRGRVEQLAKGRRVLDAYSFVGSFAMAAARGGATEVVAVDESAIALEVGAECARRNGFIDRIRYVRDDARQRLTLAGSEGGFDLVLCDPPKFAPTKSSKSGALGAYQKLAAAACRATRPGGLLLFASCSAAVGLDALTRAIAVGAREANVRAIVLERFFQGFDHPVPAAFPEGLYLKSILCSVEPV
jgi:23S rRNA (cytosine1962-C5)-methyltransferase